jgi:hypothetical protein
MEQETWIFELQCSASDGYRLSACSVLDPLGPNETAATARERVRKFLIETGYEVLEISSQRNASIRASELWLRRA